MFRIVKNLLLLIMCITLSYIYYNTDISELSIYKGSNYLLPNISDKYYYSVTSDNQIVCDLATVSNIVLNMEDDGFIKTQYKFSNKNIDVIMSDSIITYRLYYTDSKNLHILGSPYEKTKDALTYISGKKVR